MTFTAYDSGGALFPNTKKTAANQPDVRGELTIDLDLLNYLNELARKREPIKFTIAGWKKVSQKGNHFMAVKGSVPLPPRTNSYQEAKARAPEPSPFDDEPPF